MDIRRKLRRNLLFLNRRLQVLVEISSTLYKIALNLRAPCDRLIIDQNELHTVYLHNDLLFSKLRHSCIRHGRSSMPEYTNKQYTINLAINDIPMLNSARGSAMYISMYPARKGDEIYGCHQLRINRIYTQVSVTDIRSVLGSVNLTVYARPHDF